MRTFLIIYLFSYIFCAIPITEQVKSKFKVTDIGTAPEKHQQSVQNEIHDKVINYHKLGSKSDSIINQVKAKDSDEIMVSTTTASASDDFSELPSPLESPISLSSAVPIDYKLHCTKKYINDFVDFKAAQFNQKSEPNPGLSTSIKNYGGSLNHPDDLKSYTSKIVKERAEDTDFNDYNFKKFGDVSSGIITKSSSRLNFNPQLEMDEFVNYLVKFEGFHKDDLKFLLQKADLDYGLEEIEKELDKIKQIQNERERVIDIGGELSSGFVLKLPSLVGVIYLFVVSFII